MAWVQSERLRDFRTHVIRCCTMKLPSMRPNVWTIYGVQVQQQQRSLLKMLLQHWRHLLQDSVALLGSCRHIPDTYHARYLGRVRDTSACLLSCVIERFKHTALAPTCERRAAAHLPLIWGSSLGANETPWALKACSDISAVTSRTFPVMYFLQLSHWMPNMAW